MIAAFCAEDTTQAGADRLLKILKHPLFKLEDVQAAMQNKGQYLRFINSKRPFVSATAGVDAVLGSRELYMCACVHVGM